MTKYYLLPFVFLVTFLGVGQTDMVRYTLHHIANSKKIEVIIEVDAADTETLRLQIPRSAPGAYEITDYISFVENVQARTKSGVILKGYRGIGSYFIFKGKEIISKISYTVDISKMEVVLKGAFASSKVRDDYLGILGYSVFGKVLGKERNPIELTIKSDASWPIFTTLDPTQHFLAEHSMNVTDYAELVDAQYLLGKDLQLLEVEGAKIPLVIAVYAETAIDINEIGRRALLSLEGLSEYFGYIPMPHYTLCYEFLEPLSDEHDYGFSMEHMNSMTASLDTSSAIKEVDGDAKIGGIVHHMGHSWIPLRSYGEGYRPYDWGTAPIIETIWLNEGFIWYVMTQVLESPEGLQFFRGVLASAPPFIKEKSLKELSRLGSTQYSLDFDIGRNLFSRGALMAYEMDTKIKSSTNGEKSFKDALLGLLQWTEENQRAFKYEEIIPILSKSTGVDLTNIWSKWQGSPRK
ncbi:hypothetical protein ACFQ1M_01765 [Sungkyunkwania multivorans]|uniref:Peptidase M61 N-terminal domain-containing protein n=1 Tax=Sungkyunkwania multivorans TaxID=1173618 RepID=A0ABW3CT60_9FLAO